MLAVSESNRKILQIIPADGWWIGFNGTSPTGSGERSTGFMRMVCWALVENEDGTTEVVGMDGDLDTDVRFADHDQAFDQYRYSPTSDPNASEK
jgi:hypothetical protein